MNDYRFEVYTECSDFGDKVYVVRYFDVNVIGVSDTIGEAIREAQGNLEVYLNYCKEKSIPVPKPSKHIDNSANINRNITASYVTFHPDVDITRKAECWDIVKNKNIDIETLKYRLRVKNDDVYLHYKYNLIMTREEFNKLKEEVKNVR